MKICSLALTFVLVTANLFTGLFTAAFISPATQGAPAPAAQTATNATVTVNSARPVVDVVGEKSAYLATVSPDGKYIAYGKQSGRGKDRVLQLCVFEFESAGKKCSDLSPDVFDGYPYQFQWSPDSNYIAFSENPVYIASESDIWLFDRAAGAFTNLTDDGLVGVWSYLKSEGKKPVLDYLPMWNSADSMIYFWRVVPLGNMRYTIGIYRIGVDGGAPELVRDLTADFAASLPYYQAEKIFLDGIAAVSPDGATVAVLMSSFDEMGATQQTLYAIDLADATAAPKQLAGMTEFSSAIPEWAQAFPPQAQGLSWTGDGKGVVVVVNTELNPSIPFQVYYYADADGSKVTPVVDFSGLTDYESYSEPATDSDLPWRAYSPWTASLSPKGDKLLMVNDLGGTVALFTAALPPTGALPVVSASTQESPSSGVATSSRGQDGKVLTYGLLMTIDEQ